MDGLKKATAMESTEQKAKITQQLARRNSSEDADLVEPWLEFKIRAAKHDDLAKIKDAIMAHVMDVHKQWVTEVRERRRGAGDRKSTRLNSSHSGESRMPSSA